MGAALAWFLWLSVLLTATHVDAEAAGNMVDDAKDSHCFVGVVVKQALQIQQLTLQLQEQSEMLRRMEEKVVSIEANNVQNVATLTNLREKDRRLEEKIVSNEQNVATLTNLNDALSADVKRNVSTLTNRSDALSADLRGLRENVSSIESDVKRNSENLTNLYQAQSRHDRILTKEVDEVRSLRDALKSVETTLSQRKEALAALSDADSTQDRVLLQQSDDLLRLQGDVSSVQSQLDWIGGNLTSLNNTRAKQVAFSVRYTIEKIIDVGSGGTLKFPDVVTNIGNAYSPLTGHFTAPCAGTYAFYGSLRSSNGHRWIMLGIYKGDTRLVVYTAEGNGDHWDRGSGLVTTHLEKGQTVYVRQHVGGTHLEAGGLTTFSGMLLAAD